MFQLNTFTLLAVTLVSIHGLMALQVTSPTSDSVWNLKEGNTIAWTTVSTDPNTFNVVLVNNNANCAPTGMSKVLKEKVSTTDGKCHLSGVQDVKACGGYQINLVSVTNNGILAQSAPFKVSSSGWSTQWADNATTNGVQSDPNASDNTQSATNMNSTSKPSLNSQNVTSKGNSPNGTAGESPASVITLSLRTMLASSVFSAFYIMI